MTAQVDPATDVALRPPTDTRGLLGWARANLFSSWLNAILTLVSLLILWKVLSWAIGWGLVNAVWSGTVESCQAARGQGACWLAVREKHRFILFGTYTYEEQWRPFVTLILYFGLVAVSCIRAFWSRWLLAAWAVGFVVMYVLMAGGLFGLTYVPNSQWGGLPLTLMLATVGCVVAFPLGIALALGRRSDMPAIRTLSVTYIEFVRGVPLITVLFMASVMFPLFLPEGVTIDKLLRAQIGIILFLAAYLAEVVRGGLQAVPKGQYEAADSLGLGYWQKMGFIILPQALKVVIPPLVNSFIATFKDTSLVIIIGLFDLLNAANTAMKDPVWRSFYVEAYIFVALIFWVCCYFLSQYSQYIERTLETGHKRR